MGKAASRRVKEFFKNEDETEASVEFVHMFLAPFAKEYYTWGESVDDIIAAFFNTSTRRIFNAKAIRGFQMPGGEWRTNGGYPIVGTPKRRVEAGDWLLVVEDTKDGTAKIEWNERNFLLSAPEWTTIKDWLEG